MLKLVDPQPTGLLPLATLAVVMVLFFISLMLVRGAGTRGDESGARKANSSWLGIFIQGLGFFAVGLGPLVIRTEPFAPLLIGEAAAVLALAGLALLLFLTATRAMGRNWSLTARTREDHELVTSGPFALIRHPIYTGMFAFLLAMSLAFGHWRGLILGVPLFWIGTLLRVAKEEALLRTQFGAAYDAYAARVKRFVPGLV